MQSVLKIAGDAFLAELLFDTVNNGHDSLDVAIENVADLQRLERNLTIVFGFSIVWEDNTQALVCNIVDYWG
jgi:hypothetical protein